MKKKTLYIIGGIFALLLITNPSPKSFEAYAKAHGAELEVTREYNFFIASIYYGSGSSYYLGFLGNFFHLKGEMRKKYIIEQRN
jgi:hypothetical protein